LRLSRGPPLELCIDAQLPACRDHGRPRSGPFTVNESNRVADHERVCCRQVNHSLQTAGMDALFDASLFSAMDVHLIRERWKAAPMLDHPEKTPKLLAALKAAVPFEVELTERLVNQLRAQHHAGADQKHHTVSDLSYAGDEGGIVCHIVPPEKREALVVSLTQLHVPRTMPLAAAVADYQKHRVKKLKKQGGYWIGSAHADAATRAEAKGVVERWNEQLATSRDMLWSPTIRAALIAGTPWLDVFCPGCGTSRAIDLRKVDRHPLASVATLVLGLRCSWCPESAPMPRILGLHALPPVAKAAASNLWGFTRG
jgi:hypothetical protein